MSFGLLGDLESSRVISIKEQTRLVRAYYRESGNMLSDHAQTQGYPRRFLLTPANSEQIVTMLGHDGVKAFLEGAGEYLRDNQASTAIAVLANLDQGYNVPLIAPTQWGKNALLSAVNMFMGPGGYAHDGQVVQPIIWLPNNLGMEKQSQRKYLWFAQLHKFFSVQSTLTNRTIDVESYFNKLTDVRAKYFQRAAESMLPGDRHKVTELKRLLAEFSSNTINFIRSSASVIEFLTVLIQACAPHMRLAISVDESHIAIGKNCIKDRTFQSEIDDDFNFDEVADPHPDRASIRIKKTIHEVLDTAGNFGYRHPFFTVSATNHPYAHDDVNSKPVKSKIGPGYCGWNFFHGEVIDQEAEDKGWVTVPDVISIKMIAESSGDPSIALLDLAAYTSVSKWIEHVARLTGIYGPSSRDRSCTSDDLKEFVRVVGFYRVKEYRDTPHFKDRKKLIESWSHEPAICTRHKTYRRQCPEMIAKIWRWLLIDGNPKNGRGGLMRWENNNEKQSEFLAYVRKYLGADINLIEYYDTNGASPEEILFQNKDDRRPYIIVFTGKGRYGESYPLDCTYGIQFTAEASTTAAFQQGIPGRLTGYNKNPLLILSDTLYYWYSTKFLPSKGSPEGTKPAPNVNTDANPRGKYNFPLDLIGNENDPVILAIFQELDTLFVNRKDSGVKHGIADRNIPTDLFDKILTEDRMRHIESNASTLAKYPPGTKIRLLRPTTRIATDRDHSPKKYPYARYPSGKHAYGLRAVTRVKEKITDAAHHGSFIKYESAEFESDTMSNDDWTPGGGGGLSLSGVFPQIHYHTTRAGKMKTLRVNLRLASDPVYKVKRLTVPDGTFPANRDPKRRKRIS